MKDMIPGLEKVIEKILHGKTPREREILLDGFKSLFGDKSFFEIISTELIDVVEGFRDTKVSEKVELDSIDDIEIDPSAKYSFKEATSILRKKRNDMYAINVIYGLSKSGDLVSENRKITGKSLIEHLEYVKDKLFLNEIDDLLNKVHKDMKISTDYVLEQIKRDAVEVLGHKARISGEFLELVIKSKDDIYDMIKKGRWLTVKDIQEAGSQYSSVRIGSIFKKNKSILEVRRHRKAFIGYITPETSSLLGIGSSKFNKILGIGSGGPAKTEIQSSEIDIISEELYSFKTAANFLRENRNELYTPTIILGLKHAGVLQSEGNNITGKSILEHLEYVKDKRFLNEISPLISEIGEDTGINRNDIFKQILRSSEQIGSRILNQRGKYIELVSESNDEISKMIKNGRWMSIVEIEDADSSLGYSTISMVIRQNENKFKKKKIDNKVIVYITPETSHLVGIDSNKIMKILGMDSKQSAEKDTTVPATILNQGEVYSLDMTARFLRDRNELYTSEVVLGLKHSGVLQSEGRNITGKSIFEHLEDVKDKLFLNEIGSLISKMEEETGFNRHEIHKQILRSSERIGSWDRNQRGDYIEIVNKSDNEISHMIINGRWMTIDEIEDADSSLSYANLIAGIKQNGEELKKKKIGQNVLCYITPETSSLVGIESNKIMKILGMDSEQSAETELLSLEIGIKKNELYSKNKVVKFLSENVNELYTTDVVSSLIKSGHLFVEGRDITGKSVLEHMEYVKDKRFLNKIDDLVEEIETDMKMSKEDILEQVLRGATERLGAKASGNKIKYLDLIVQSNIYISDMIKKGRWMTISEMQEAGSTLEYNSLTIKINQYSEKLKKSHLGRSVICYITPETLSLVGIDPSKSEELLGIEYVVKTKSKESQKQEVIQKETKQKPLEKRMLTAKNIKLKLTSNYTISKAASVFNKYGNKGYTIEVVKGMIDSREILFRKGGISGQRILDHLNYVKDKRFLNQLDDLVKSIEEDMKMSKKSVLKQISFGFTERIGIPGRGTKYIEAVNESDKEIYSMVEKGRWMTVEDLTQAGSEFTRYNIHFTVKKNSEEFKRKKVGSEIVCYVTPESLSLLGISSTKSGYVLGIGLKIGEPTVKEKSKRPGRRKEVKDTKTEDTSGLEKEVKTSLVSKKTQVKIKTNKTNFPVLGPEDPKMYKLSGQDVPIYIKSNYSKEGIKKVLILVNSGAFGSDIVIDKVINKIGTHGSKLEDFVRGVYGMMSLSATATRIKISSELSLPYEFIEPYLMSKNLKDFVQSIPDIFSYEFIKKYELDEIKQALKEEMGKEGEEIAKYWAKLSSKNLMPNTAQYNKLVQVGVLKNDSVSEIRKSYQAFYDTMNGYDFLDTGKLIERIGTSQEEFKRNHVIQLKKQGVVKDLVADMNLNGKNSFYVVSKINKQRMSFILNI